MPLLAAALAIGCDRDDHAPDSAPAGQHPSAAPAPAKAVTLGSGTISGRVLAPGFSPSAPITADFCTDMAHAPQLARAEQLVVNPNHTLRNVLVYLKDVQAPLPTGSQAVLLDQVHCRYVPRVIALQTGQTLTVHSSDNTLHNVHFLTQSNPAVNIGMTQAGASKDFTFKNPERFDVKCDVHPWMLAHVAVFPHPFFAVTGEDGTFTIRNVPAGTYQIAAWQERLDPQEQTITVTDAQTATLDFTFKPPE